MRLAAAPQGNTYEPFLNRPAYDAVGERKVLSIPNDLADNVVRSGGISAEGAPARW
jgi:hypothetical protein